MNPAPDKQSADLNRVFFTSSHAVVAILIGYGFALTAAYIATHYQNFRRPAIMLGVVALVPGLVGAYTGIGNTFYGGLGVTPYRYILLLFLLIAGAVILATFAAQRVFRLTNSNGDRAGLGAASMVDRDRERVFFFVFAGAALVLICSSLWLVFGRAGSLSLAQIQEGLARLFAPHQYSLPAIAGFLVLAIVVAFILALLIYRRRAPLAVTLGLFAVMPVASGLSHWASSEQRNHWFGYWFGHDMFTPPVVGADGKMTYDSKVREQMLKGPNGSLVYPEMTTNTILFGGTDPGRFNPTYMIFCDSFVPTNCLPEFDPAFDRRDVYLITQNALADGTYLNYLRAQYFRSQQVDPPFFSEMARFLLKDDRYDTNLLAKLVSPLDWYFESRGARIEKRWRTYTSWFSDSDFLNVKSFAATLRNRQDPVSKWVFENLSKEAQDLLSAPAPDETRLRIALQRDLNALIEREQKQREQLKKLQQQKDAVDQKLWVNENPELRDKQAALARQIASFKIDRLYDTNRFARVQLSDYLKSFIAQNPQGDTRIRLNRLLLEAAYPAEIARSKGGVYPDREIYIPSTNDLTIAFSDYSNDAAQRKRHDDLFPNEPRQIRPGEFVDTLPDGRVQVAGQTAVMSINGLLTKVIFDHNPTNDFYVEESFPLDWMFPHLAPYGIIMKINRQPLPEITDEICRRDHEFWSKYSDRLVGNWITYDTPLKDIVEFCEKVYLRHNYAGFTGNHAFLRDESAQKAFSKLRSAIGGIYSWRLGLLPGVPTPLEYQAKTEAERQRMLKEADFTYRQAFAFCPYSPEVMYRYVNLLMSQMRFNDALMVAETCRKFDPENGAIVQLVQQLQGYAKQPAAALEMQNQAAQLDADFRANSNDFQKAVDLMQRYVQLGQNGQAFDVADRVVANPRATADVLAFVTQLSLRFKNSAKAEAALDKMVQLNSTDLETWGFVAEGYASLNKTQAVDTAVGRMQQLAPGKLQTWLHAAQAYIQLNQLPNVETALEKVVQIEPNQPETWYDLAAARAALGKTGALQDLRRAIELSDKRLAQSTNTRDLRKAAETDPQFARFRSQPEYKAALAK